MALKATIYKAELNIADMDRHYYQTHSLTIACHPSETMERMMVRILVFALHAHERLSFTKGLSTDDEPDVWQKSLTDEIEVWIELGQPDEKRIRKACGRARQVFIYTYSTRAAAIWWQQIKSSLNRFANLKVRHIKTESVEAMAALAARNMDLQVNIQDGQVWLTDGKQNLTVEFAEFE